MFYKTLFPIIKNHLSTIIGSILDMQLILIADTDDFLRCSVVTDHQIHRRERSVLAHDGPYLLQRSVGERLFRYPYLDDASQPLLVKERELLHVWSGGSRNPACPRQRSVSRSLRRGFSPRSIRWPGYSPPCGKCGHLQPRHEARIRFPYPSRRSRSG